MLIVVQIFCLFGAFVSLGKTLDKKDNVREKVIAILTCIVFLMIVLYTEVVLKQ